MYDSIVWICFVLYYFYFYVHHVQQHTRVSIVTDKSDV